ncbi:MAG: hypothetical protein JNL57_10780 [Bacteroidetes bacterium]|nr:hypothetical protein [Bacteroidota bacterium]
MNTAIKFLNAWKKAVNEHKEELKKKWQNPTEFTNFIKGDNGTIIFDVARELKLECYPKDYYFIDALLYKKEDIVDGVVANTFGITGISVAFEHENKFDKHLYTETCKMLTVCADLKVIVTYPQGPIGYKPTDTVMDFIHTIIKSSRHGDQISELENLLFIFGYQSDFEWEGYVFKKEGWKQIG